MSSHFLSSHHGSSHFLSSHFGRGEILIQPPEQVFPNAPGMDADARLRRAQDDDDVILAIIMAFMDMKDRDGTR